MSEDKKAVELPRPEATTVEIATLPVILGELRQLRKEGQERGDRAERSIKDLALQVQSNYESHGGKIRSLEGTTEQHGGKIVALERRADTLEKDAKHLKGQIAELRGDTTRQVSLTEEEMAKALEEEAQERNALDEQVNNRIAPLETKFDVLSTMLVQSFGLHLPPKPNPDGSLPPPDERRRKPKNAIEKQTFWTRVAAIMGGLVVVAGTLDKMGVFEFLSKLFGH